MLTSDPPLDVLSRCWQVWRDVLVPLDPDARGSPTRSIGWDVKTLVTHHAGWVLGFAEVPTIDEVATVGVVEATVHGLDLLDALGLPTACHRARSRPRDRRPRRAARPRGVHRGCDRSATPVPPAALTGPVRPRGRPGGAPASPALRGHSARKTRMRSSVDGNVSVALRARK
jgi:hypothetical protein